MKRTYKLLLTTAAAALITVSAVSASVLLTKPAASAFDSGFVAVDATSDDAMGWLGLEHDGALDIRDGYTETVDADIASERVLQLYGKSVTADSATISIALRTLMIILPVTRRNMPQPATGSAKSRS